MVSKSRVMAGNGLLIAVVVVLTRFNDYLSEMRIIQRSISFKFFSGYVRLALLEVIIGRDSHGLKQSPSWGVDRLRQ